MKVTWLGQSGYLFESNKQRLLIDPFYSDIVEERQGLKRLMQPPMAIKELKPDLIFITHNHMDHFDPVALPVIHRQFPIATIAGPESVMQKAMELNFDETVLVKMEKGSNRNFGAFTINATPAYHGDLHAVGCLIEIEGKIIYYSGDTLLTDTLINEIKAISKTNIDYLFIIINGKLGNMNCAEAVEVATQLKPAVSIPMHYGMFEENTADPNEFIKGCEQAGITSRLMTLGETVEL